MDVYAYSWKPLYFAQVLCFFYNAIVGGNWMELCQMFENEPRLKMDVRNSGYPAAILRDPKSAGVEWSEPDYDHWNG